MTGNRDQDCSAWVSRLHQSYALYVKTNTRLIVLDSLFFFFFQAEDGIRDYKVTGVQTCALPISQRGDPAHRLGAAADVAAPAWPRPGRVGDPGVSAGSGGSRRTPLCRLGGGTRKDRKSVV